jgi:Ca-activated chloride channel homolog
MFRFQDPWVLYGLLLVPALVYFYIIRLRQKSGAVRFSSLGTVKQIPASLGTKLRHVLIVLRGAAFALLVLALARPQSGQVNEEVSTEGVDIMLLLDVSGSMRATDMSRKKESRLQLSKVAIDNFIRDRKSDRIGLVVFGGESFLLCPLTLDYGVLFKILENVKLLMAADDRTLELVAKTASVEDGTAIGNAILNAANRLRDSKAKSRVLILLTDGANNRGEIQPLKAAQAAAAVGIKIYTIGAGADGEFLEPQQTIFGMRYVPARVEPIDEPTLQEIARIGQGRYYRAVNQEKLIEVYKDISRLEKTEIKTKQYTRYRELFPWFLIPGFLLLALEIVLANTRFRKLP